MDVGAGAGVGGAGGGMDVGAGAGVGGAGSAGWDGGGGGWTSGGAAGACGGSYGVGLWAAVVPARRSPTTKTRDIARAGRNMACLAPIS
jgi:hypothetical protein